MISIIVPVYNVEKWLRSCIDSILSQTYTDFELLLIDDGSTDMSGSICDEYASKDSRVQVFHQENGGVTSARRLGVEMAKGEWVSFVDADDELYVDALDVFCKNINEPDVDIICTDLKFKGLISGDEYVKKTLCGLLYNRVWGNLYRRSLLTDWVFDIPRKIYVGEDALMNIRIGLSMSSLRAKCIKERIYMYRLNLQSVINTMQLSLAYEELFMQELKGTLGRRIEDFRDEYNFSNLCRLEALIVSRIPVDYNRPWIVELRNFYKGKNKTLRQWIVLNVSQNLVCKYILAIEKRINKLFANG